MFHECRELWVLKELQEYTVRFREPLHNLRAKLNKVKQTFGFVVDTADPLDTAPRTTVLRRDRHSEHDVIVRQVLLQCNAGAPERSVD